MKSKTIRFGRAIVLSILFFMATFSLLGAEHEPNSAWTAVHIWAGALMLIGSAVHLATNMGWIKTVIFRPGKTLSRRMRQNRRTDLGLLVSGAICTLTGVLWLISSRTLAAMSRPHTISGILMIVLLGIHLLLHWQWMVDTARQMRQSQSEKAHRPAQETMPLE